MSEVGDAIELIYITAPNATVTLSWLNRDTGEVQIDSVPVVEQLDDEGAPTGRFPVVVIGDTPGLWEARFVSVGTADTVESYYERVESPFGPPPLAALHEYEELYGTLSVTRQATARALLLRASRLLRDTYPGLDSKIASGTVASGTVGVVVMNMVAQVMRNPGGLRAETTGPFSRSYDPEAASGLLQLSAADRELLASAGLTGSSGRRGRIGTARIGANMAPPGTRPGRRWPRGPGGTFPSGW